MRHMSPQLPLTAPWIDHPHAHDISAMSALLDSQPALSALVQQDLEAQCRKNSGTGRPGLTGEQTLRLLLVRQLTGWTYSELAFHLADSVSYRAFCRLGALTATPSKSALAATLRRVRVDACRCEQAAGYERDSSCAGQRANRAGRFYSGTGGDTSTH